MSRLSWADWQRDVLDLIRKDFHELLRDIDLDDVDWQAWQPLYAQGRSPRAAVDRAFERDL